MADKRDAFLREVDEELRKEQLLQLWQRYGMVVVGALGLVLLSMIGWQYAKHRAQTEAEAAGARFEAASRQLGEAPSKEALDVFAKMATDAPRGYRSLARLRVAAEHQKAGRPAEALAEYESVAKEQGFDQVLRDFAMLQAAMLRMDAADWTEMQNRLTPLVSGNSAWRTSAREGLALAALKAGKADVARQHLEGLLADRTVTPQMSERVQLLLSVLTDQEAGKTPAEKGAPADGSKGADGKGAGATPATTAPKK